MKSIRPVLASIAIAILSAPAFAEDAVGKWVGTLAGADGPVPVKLSVDMGADGKLTATGEGPQGPVKVESVATDGKSLSFTAPELMGKYSATWDDASKSWVGMFNQAGTDQKMVFKRAS
jgi:hypothetical protein